MVISMERWIGKVAIVTGASSGIGAAIAKKLVEEGLLVVGLARRGEIVDKLSKELVGQKGKLISITTDITKEEDILKAFRWTTENVGPVHILVNNAGVHFRSSLLDGATADWRQTFDVNVLGLCIATREASKIMRDSNIDGHIIHINSIGGHKPVNMPNLDVYQATKYGVTALTETLRTELVAIQSKIRITSISPGAVDTDIFTEEDRKSDMFTKNIGDKILKPEDIADAVVYVLSTPPHVQVEAALVFTGPAAPANNTETDFWTSPAASSVLDEQSPLPLDNREGGLFAGGFVPPPPRPLFLDNSATPDGPTTCDLCSWAWHNDGGVYVYDATRDVPGELGWVLTLVIVSLTSALLGAIIMIVVLHCRRLKTAVENESENGVPLNQRVMLSHRLQVDGAEDKEICTITSSNCPHIPSLSNANSGVWSWLSRRTTSSPSQLTSPSTLPVENHYTHMEDGYNSVGEALYAELDRESATDGNGRDNNSPAYQNSAYNDPDAPVSSTPSSAYYSDLSTTTVQDRAYEIVGLSSLTNWELNSDIRRPIHRLAAISETVSVPSDYV